MDKLTFTNASGQTIEFSATSDYKWRQVTDMGGIEAVAQATSSPYQDGSTPAGDSYFQSRLIKVDFVIVSDTVNTLIRTLNSRLNPKLGVGTLTYTVGENERVLDKVKVKSTPTKDLDNDKSGTTFQFSSVLFEAYDPLYSDQEYTEEEVAANALLFEFPVDVVTDFEFDVVYTDGVPINNVGDVDCPITLIVDGAITQPLEIENSTTGEKVVIGLDLLDNERLTITTAIDNINVIKTDLTTGEETVAFEYIDVSETTFFYLVRGENKIKVTANEGDVESATIKFKNKYVGV